MKRTLKKSLNIIPYLILMIAFILIISLTFSLRKGETPTIFGRAIFLVVTPSMEDTIMTGDVIFVDTTPDKLFVGDIISFRKPGEEDKIITHRIIEIEDIDGTLLFTTQGDNNNESLEWELDFTEDFIVGKYIGKSAMLGTVYQFLFANGFNMIFLIIITVFIIIGGMEVSSIIKTLSIQKQKEILLEKEKMIQEELRKLRQQKEEGE